MTELFQDGERADGTYMKLRWFYSRAQLIREVDVSKWEATSPRHQITACELLVSVIIESDPEHVLNITYRVLLGPGRSEYAKQLSNNNQVCHKRLCRMFYNPKHWEFIDSLAFRFLEQGELLKLLRRANNSEIFYRPMDRRAARKVVDREAEVSQAICDADEVETKEEERLKRFKCFIKKFVAKDSRKFVSQAERLNERISEQESSCEEDTS